MVVKVVILVVVLVIVDGGDAGTAMPVPFVRSEGDLMTC